MGSVTTLKVRPASTWPVAVDAFLAARDLSPGSQRVYGLTLHHVGAALPTQTLSHLDPGDITAALAAAFPQALPATWNRHVATVRSFLAYTTRQGWTTGGLGAGVERRREVIDHNRALTRAEVTRLLERKDVPVRERCLWNMLYDTAARSSEILRLNVEDLDLGQRQAATIRKGGAIDTLHWTSRTARLLPYVINGRGSGPAFLSSRPVQARRAPARADIDPTTGLPRLSYGRAAEIFTSKTEGWTLHQLRHSALTHLADDGTPLNLLMAKSRHQSLRTMQRYLHPSAEAVARLTAQHDPASRRLV